MTAAQRGRKRESQAAFNRFALKFFLVCIVLGVIGSILQAMAAHPIASFLIIGVLAAGGIAFGALKWQQHQNHTAQLAYQRQLAAFQHAQWQQKEAARIAREQHLWSIRAQASDTYHQMNADEFEKALAFLCERDGCTNVEVVGGAGDLGADVSATTPHGTRLVIQAKRYAQGNQVKGPDLQKFAGTCYGIHGADVAAVITTSGFTKQARTLAAQLGIKLYDGEALAAWASHTGHPPWTSQ
jgi:restriction system protein